MTTDSDTAFCRMFKKQGGVVSKEAGFGLIGLSLGMIAMGAFLAMMVHLIPDPSQNKRVHNTDYMESNRAALIGYAVANKKLPEYDEFKTVIPRYADGFGNTIFYAYDNRLTEKDALCNDALFDRTHDDYPESAGNGGTDGAFIKIDTEREVSPAAITAEIDNVAFVIWSNGFNAVENSYRNTDHKKRPGGVTDTAVGSVSADADDRIYDATGYDNNNTTGTAKDDNDDIVLWATMEEIRAKANCIDE
ncbi:MAG: hypothetical protein HQL50_02655 [Magnetococcales bacterium]|nr:hypothetical protein [Magnetococcales bacterium]